jgi:hypothetical protein
MDQRLLLHHARLLLLHLLRPRLRLLPLKPSKQLKMASLLGLRACLVPANQWLQRLCVPQLTVRSAIAVEILVALIAVNNAILAVNAQNAASELKVKANVVMAGVATHAVAVVANVLENAVLNATPSAVTKFVAKPVQKVVPRGALKAETKVAVHVQTVVISAMNLALT